MVLIQSNFEALRTRKVRTDSDLFVRSIPGWKCPGFEDSFIFQACLNNRLKQSKAPVVEIPPEHIRKRLGFQSQARPCPAICGGARQTRMPGCFLSGWDPLQGFPGPSWLMFRRFFYQLCQGLRLNVVLHIVSEKCGRDLNQSKRQYRRCNRMQLSLLWMNDFDGFNGIRIPTAPIFL